MPSGIMKSLRSIGARPVLSLTVIGTLALALGGSGAVFSLVYGILLRPLPFPEPRELVSVKRVDTNSGDEMRVSPQILSTWRARLGEEAALAGFTSSLLHVKRDEGGARRVVGAVVTEGFFEMLGVRPLVGRVLEAPDYQYGAARVLVVGESYWRRELSASPGAVGRHVEISGARYQVVGVVGDEVQIGHEVGLWVPMAIQPNRPGWGGEGSHRRRQAGQ